jgi:hypothetical protein
VLAGDFNHSLVWDMPRRPPACQDELRPAVHSKSA